MNQLVSNYFGAAKKQTLADGLKELAEALNQTKSIHLLRFKKKRKN